MGGPVETLNHELGRWEGQRAPARPKLVRVEDVAAGLGMDPDRLLAAVQRAGIQVFRDDGDAAWISQAAAAKVAGNG